MKSRIDVSTISDCQEIFSTSIPMGRSPFISSSRLSMRPTSTRLAPGTCQGNGDRRFPLCRMIVVGGVR